MTSNRTPTQRLLRHLGLQPRAPTLDFLNDLVREHQLRVPFETLTKLIDYDSAGQRGDFMPPLDEYVERIVGRGGGGLCWTLARGFQALLTELGFDASLMVMVPGHCCVRVELPQGPQGPQYADVGYAAPIFRAYPLYESFTLQTHREVFEYSVRDQGIFVTRNPGPTKQLDPVPRRLEDLSDLIAAANDWSVPHSFLHRLVYARHVDGVYTSFRDGVLTRYVSGVAETVEVAPDAVAAALARIFGVDPALVEQALQVRRRFGASSAAP